MASINGKKDPKVSPKKAPAKKATAKKKAPKKKAPGKTSKSAQGATYVQKVGVEEHSTEFVPVAFASDGYLTANVNVSMGARVGMPNYSDVRCGASLTIPCKPIPEEIDKAFDWAKEWVETRVQGMIDENTGGEDE